MHRHLWTGFFPETAPTAAEATACECGGDCTPEDGMHICVRCGNMRPYIDLAAEWRYYGDDTCQNPQRVGMPVNPLLLESSLGCNIGGAGPYTRDVYIIQRHIRWSSMPYKERARYNDFKHIEVMASNAGIPKMIIDEACHYHNLIAKEQTFRGENRDAIIAASIYIACRMEQVPRTAKEIAKIFFLEHTSATKGCKTAMGIIETMQINQGVFYGNTTTRCFIERYCSQLNVKPDMIKLAEFIALQIEKYHLIPENIPNSVAAGIIYFLSETFGLHLKEVDITQVCGISEVTIRKCFRKIESLREKLLPAAVYKKYVMNSCT
jgi:transcription initiation factor TFIIB